MSEHVLAHVDLDNPQWDSAGRVHDWRNYIGKRTRALWPALTMTVRVALALDAQEQADGEEWD